MTSIPMKGPGATPIATRPRERYYQVPVKHYAIADATLAVRVFGQGPPLVLVHGFFVHGYTWRHLLEGLSAHFTCYVVDLPGFGDSRWAPDTDFSFAAQAQRLATLCDTLGLGRYHILAHDTGASIARLVALRQGQQVLGLALINTEMPGHRPPFVPMYQTLAKLPLANGLFRALLRVGFMIRSPMLMGPFFHDKAKLGQTENTAPYVDPLKKSRHAMTGMLGYLIGITWPVVDQFENTHREITAKTLLVWGEQDKTFPIHLARKMATQFEPHAQFATIPNACLMPHEEQPAAVLKAVLPFLAT